jgi:serine/threonine protein kinase
MPSHSISDTPAKDFDSVSLKEVFHAGPPSAPIGFPAPEVSQGEIVRVAVACRTSTLPPTTVNVLRRRHDKGKIGIAYLWPGLTIHQTLSGEIILSEKLNPIQEDTTTLKNMYEHSGKRVAIKVDHRTEIRQLHHGTQAPSENPWKEVAALQFLSQYIKEGDNHIALLLDALQDDTNLYEVFPFYEGKSLHNLVQHYPRGLSEADARCLFRQLLHAVSFCHSHGVCHRDISTHNLLLDGKAPNFTNNLVLIDFSMSIRIPYSYPDDDRTEDTTDISAGTCRRRIHMHSHCGKLPFMSPEMYRQEDIDGLSLDLWSAAVVLFVLLTGRPPYHRPDPGTDNDFYDLMDETYYWGHSIPRLVPWGRNLSDNAVDLLHKMFQKDMTKRLTLSEVMQHPWLHSTN